MSNNAPDYENNLAFPPRHDETAYELQLKVNKLEKQLKIAVEGFKRVIEWAENVEPYEDMSNLSMCGELAEQIIKELDK